MKRRKKPKRRTLKKRENRQKKLGKNLGRALDLVIHTPGNIFDHPRVKRHHQKWMAYNS